MSMPNAPFNRAAANYDNVRGFPPGIGDLVADAAAATLAGRSPVLELGIGTGRVARLLLARGVPLVGLDLSRGMLQQLLATLPAGQPPPPLVEADIETMPLADASVGAVVAVHVLHLLGNWPAALAEIRRVLRPGGVLLAGHEWRPPLTPGTRLMERWREIVRAHGFPIGEAGTRDVADITAGVLAPGARFKERVVGEWVVRRSVARQIETIEHRTWSASWDVPAGFFEACLAELRAWAAVEFGGLERETEVPHRFVWQSLGWPPEA
jgi:SAM-dependent methyltransferase